MKAAFILFAFVLFTSTSFARMRSILVEVTVPNDGVPTVSIYSAYENEQCVCVSIAEASKVLYRVRQPGNMLDVSVLINGWIKNELLWELLDGLKKNDGAEMVYLEVNRFYSVPGTSNFSERGKELQNAFKVPAYTKKTSQ